VLRAPLLFVNLFFVPGSRAKFRTALLRKLPFEAEIVLCEGRDLMRLEMENPFGTQPSPPDVVRFVSILSKAGGVRASLPVTFPSDGEWLVRVIASEGQFVFGVYRRHMKTIGYLGQIDKLYGGANKRSRLGIVEMEHNARGGAILRSPGYRHSEWLLEEISSPGGARRRNIR
jgi:hypothetical protein